MNNNRVFIIPTITILLIVCGACPNLPGYTAVTDPRTFVIDVENAMFNAAAAANAWERGLGLTSLTLTIYTLDAAGAETPVTQAVTSGILDPTYSCTRFPLAISGTLARVEASGSTGTGATYTATISDKAETDVFEGWTMFANCLKVKLGFAVDYNDAALNSLFYRVAPLGGSSALLAYDAGAPGAGAGFTDGASVLVSKQIAVQPRLQENPTGLTYDIHTAVVGANIAELYNEEMNLGAYYTDKPWSSLWTYAEITATGRNVAGSVYTLTKLNTAPCNILDPLGDGKKYYLIDFTTSTDPSITDKFMLIAIVLHCGDLSTPAKVICVDIR